MWRHEDIWRTLAGGIDFVTGVPLADEWEQSRQGLEDGGFVKLCAAPLIHGDAQVAALAGLFAGETVVLLPPSTRTRSGARSSGTRSTCWSSSATRWPGRWSRPTWPGTTTPPRWSPSPPARRCSRPAVKDACAKALPNVVITEAIGSTETGFAGISFVTPASRTAAARP